MWLTYRLTVHFGFHEGLTVIRSISNIDRELSPLHTDEGLPFVTNALH